MKPELVTVVIPTHNYEMFIIDAVESAAAQTYKELEIIVVNDGSTDGTQERLEEVATENPALRIIQTDHLGVSNARNVGTEAARGTYIAYLDADDLWHPTKIAKQVAAIEKHSHDPEWAAVYCFFRSIDREARLIGSSPPFETRGYFFARHLIVNHIGNGSGLLVRRDVVLDVGGFNTNLTFCEDIDLQLRILQRYKMEVVREYLVGYRVHKHSATRRHLEMADAVVETMERHTSDPLIPGELKKATLAAVDRYIWHKHVRGGNHGKGVQTLLKALAAEPHETLADLFTRLDGLMRKHLSRLRRLGRRRADDEEELFLNVSPSEGVPSREPPAQARQTARFCKFDRLLYEKFVVSNR